VRFRLRLVSCLLISVIVEHVCLGVDEGELRRVQDGILTNGESWNRYDVLINIECIVPIRKETLGGKILDSDERRPFTRSVRLAIDHKTEEVFMFSKMDIRDVPPDSELGLAKDGVVSISELVCVTGRKVYRMNFPGGDPTNGGIAPYMVAMQMSSVPDLRCIGLGGLSATFGPMGSFERCLLLRAKPWNSKDEREYVAETKGEIQFTRTGKSNIVATQQFSKATMMPIRLNVVETIGNDKVTLVDELYTWKEFDGVFVPDSVSNEETQVISNDHRVNVYQSLETRWVSFGEPINPELIELAAAKDYSKLLKCLDPAALGN
jgi:hypothetical protein